MKFSLSWLREYLDTDASLEEICATLNRIGLEVEGVEDPAAQLKGFLTAEIMSAERHPDADRLQVCRVNAGAGFEDVQVVCGAPNARTGLHVIFAPPGTYIPASGMTIKAGKIRGQASGGMLCSTRELGLGEDHDGIAELPENAPLGEDYAQYAELIDPVIDIAITPNRGDALAVRGVARDLAAAGLGTLKPRVSKENAVTEPNSPFTWHIKHPACSYVTGRVIRGVKNGPSPAWLKRRLESVGLRPQSALVDVTNYLMQALGRPLHVFDANKLSGDTLTLDAAQDNAGKGETFAALDGQEYVLKEGDLVIRDAAGVQSLAGIMGGAESSVSEATTDVFVESALFDAVQVALTGRRLGLQTDARYRFERGVDLALTREGLEEATALILELCGGKAGPIVEAGTEPAWQRQATLRFARVRELAGLDVEADEAVAMLEGLGFETVTRDAEKAVFAVPSWRNDIACPANVLEQAVGLPADKAEKAAARVAEVEAEAELVEEILRLRGIDSVKPQPLPQTTLVPAAAMTPKQARVALLRRLCAGRGLMETVGFSFVSAQEAEQFGGAPEQERLLNPIAADLNQLRPTPLIGLLRALDRNLARGLGQEGEAAFFEIGPAFGAQGGKLVLAGVRGGVTARAPSQPARSYGWEEAKADLTAALVAMGVTESALNTVAEAPGYYHPGRSGQLRQGPKMVLGTFGELHPRVARSLGLNGRVAMFELALEAIPLPKAKRRSAPVLSALQPVRRDFAFLAGPEVKAQEVLKAVRGADRTMPERGMIEQVRLFDVFEGGKLPEGYRSLGVEVTLQPSKESLTDAQLEVIGKAIEAAVEKATGATLRG